MKHIQVIGHRGASGYAPENTLASFKKAIDLGVDYIELDVHLTKDQEVLIIHDHTVDRTTNGAGKVSELTALNLSKLDAGSWFNKDFAGERLPLLSEVLELAEGKCKVLIEIKRGADFYSGIEKKVLKTIKGCRAEDWCEVQTFHDHILNNWLAMDSGIPVYKLVVRQVGPFYYDDGWKTGDVIKKWKGKVSGINPLGKAASKNFIEKIHAAGMKTYTWTINDEKLMKQLIENGADGIISNFPDKVTRSINENKHYNYP